MKKIVAILIICSPLLVQAQAFQVSLQGQKQQGMAGTGTAYMQDGAALFFNPGGVAFLKKNGISAGATAVMSHVKYADQASATVSETQNPVGTPFTGYVVMGSKQSRFRYGIASYTPFGSTIEWQPGWTGRFALTRLSLAAIYFQPTVSFKITEQLGIGAGFVYGMGAVNLQRDLPMVDSKGDYGKAELNGKGQGYGFNAGLYYRPYEHISFGFNYRSEVKMNMDKGTATFTVPASLAASFPSGNFSSSLPLPKVITLAGAYTMRKKLTMALDASMVGWKSFDTLTFDYEQNTSELQDTKSARNYKNTFAYRMGFQYAVNSKLDARAGIKYLITPVRDGYVSPDVPDATHVNFSAGLGYKFSPHFGTDMSFTFQSMERTDTNIETQMTGTYKTYIFMPGISINYNF
jgi:long-chain fatty acid transport protein